MKQLIRVSLAIALLSSLAACGSVQIKERLVAMTPEQAMEHAANRSLGEGSNQHLVSHTCVSQPIFGLAGEYVRTAVRCY